MFGGTDDEPLKHLGEAQTCYVIKNWPEFAGSWWISDDREAVRYAKLQGITTRETIDLMTIAVVDGDIAPDAFDLMQQWPTPTATSGSPSPPRTPTLNRASKFIHGPPPGRCCRDAPGRAADGPWAARWRQRGGLTGPRPHRRAVIGDLDSAAVVKLAHAEPGSAALRRWLDERAETGWISSVLTEIEAFRALARYAPGRGLPPARRAGPDRPDRSGPAYPDPGGGRKPATVRSLNAVHLGTALHSRLRCDLIRDLRQAPPGRGPGGRPPRRLARLTASGADTPRRHQTVTNPSRPG